jgi:PAS domain S-box-containing protein
MRHCFHHLFGGTSSGALLINGNGEIEQANEAAAALLGCTPAFLINRPLDNLIFREPYEEGSQLQKFCNSRHTTPIELEKRLIRHDQSLVWVHFCLQTSHNSPGQAWYGLIMLTDISYRKALEAKLKKLLGQQECVMLQIHAQLKQNMALLQLAGSLPDKHLCTNTEEINSAKAIARRAKELPWVYSSVYIREKTSGIGLHKHLQAMAGQLMRPFVTGYPGHRLSLSLEPLYVNAMPVNLLGSIVHELLDQALRSEDALHMRLSFGAIRGTSDYLLGWQCCGLVPDTAAALLQSVELVSMLAASLQGEATLSYPDERCLRLDIRFHDFAAYAEQVPGRFASHVAAGY